MRCLPFFNKVLSNKGYEIRKRPNTKNVACQVCINLGKTKRNESKLEGQSMRSTVLAAMFCKKLKRNWEKKRRNSIDKAFDDYILIET